MAFVLPDGRRFRAEGPEPGPVAEVHIHHPDAFARLVRDGDLVIITKGDLMGVMGGTNAMKIVRVGDLVAPQDT